MSGVGEVGAIVGLITGTIEIVRSTKHLYSALKDVKGQPKQFRSIAAKFPLLLEILRNAEKNVQPTKLNDGERDEAENNIKACHEKVDSLKKIFNAVLREDDDKWLDRYKKAVVALGKGKRAEELMREIMEHIEFVTCDRLMGTATTTQIEKLQEAIQEMLDMSSSIPDDGKSITQHHTGSGHNIASTVTNNNIGEGTYTNSNTGEGPQLNNNSTGTFNYNNHSSSEKSTSLLQSLAFSKMDVHQKNIPKAVENTCQWLCDEQDYKDWLARSQRLLWIVGIPGSGKSTIMKYIHKQNTVPLPRTEPPKKLIVASFFCYGAGDPIQKTRIGLFRSLLHQILKQIPELPLEVTSYFDKRSNLEVKPGESLEWHQEDLEQMLQTSISYIAKEYPDEYVLRIYVDALDEFGSNEPNGSKEPRDLAEYFQHLTSLDILGIELSVCISCRDYPFIAKGGLKVSIENKNRRDILTYVQNKLGSVKGEDYEAQQLTNWIAETASGIFQWAVIVAEKARDFNEYIESPKRIFEELKDLPQGLDKLYEKSFQTMDTDHRSQSLQLLRWVCFAERPLSVEEIHDALLLDSSVTTWQKSIDCKKSCHEMENIIKRLSCNLVVIQKTPERYQAVQLRHQSVHDYLVSGGLQHLSDINPTSTSLASSVIHLQLLRFCLHYLSLKEVVTRCDVLSALLVDAKVRSVQFESIDYDCPFLSYAIKHWAYHAKLAEDDNSEEGDILRLYQCLSEVPFERLDKVSYWNYYDERGMTLLHVASRYGLLKLVKWIFKSQNNPRLAGITTNSEKRHTVNGIIGKLSQMTFKKVDVDMKTPGDMTPLAFAIKGRHETMVKHLVENYNANVNTTILRGLTALIYAAIAGNTEIVKLLLKNSKIKVNVIAEWSGSALTAAAHRGKEEIIKLLLQHSKIDPNAKSMQGDTGISCAIELNQPGIVALLLKHNKIDPNANNGFMYQFTELGYAVALQREKIVDLLLQHNKIDPNGKNKRGNTALLRAVKGNQEGIVGLLLQHNKIDPNANNELSQTPLSAAVTYRYKAIATLLLQHIEINVNKPGHTGATPLFHAAEYGYEEMVILLLEKSKADIDISARNKYNQSPLTIAIENKHWATVEILLKYRKRMSIADEQVAQALENLSLEERRKMSDAMKKSPLQDLERLMWEGYE